MTDAFWGMIIMIVLGAFFLFYTFGGVHALFDGWRPWKHGIRWWRY